MNVKGFAIDKINETITVLNDQTIISRSWKDLIPPPRVVADITNDSKYTPPDTDYLWMAYRTYPSRTPRPVLRMGNYTYWPLTYADNRMATLLLATDVNGKSSDSRVIDGVRYVEKITVDSKGVAFHGDNKSAAITLDNFDLSYKCCFQLTAQDFLDAAELFQTPLTSDAAHELAQKFSIMTVDECNARHGGHMSVMSLEGGIPIHTMDVGGMWAGAVTGTAVGASAGAFIGGPIGAAAVSHDPQSILSCLAY